MPDMLARAQPLRHLDAQCAATAFAMVADLSGRTRPRGGESRIIASGGVAIRRRASWSERCSEPATCAGLGAFVRGRAVGAREDVARSSLACEQSSPEPSLAVETGRFAMTFDDIAEIVRGVPYTQVERGRKLYEHIVSTRPEECLELGFAHGVATCYIAAALQEAGGGRVTCVDLEGNEAMDPNVEQLLDKAGLRGFVDIRREKNSYNWFLKKEIEQQSASGICAPKYDFCFIDGPKNWTIDGLAFFLVDKLLKT
ncbi:MAG: class I SAM-dependent methyltransferase, partial [Caulobacterales bacterium]|nr:class I SAM-dependent methyltransferase [Caulobacterales bacterium]